MTSVCFVGTCPPTKCGIADYISFLLNHSPADWRWLSFCPEEGELATGAEGDRGKVWRGIPGPRGVSAPILLKGLRELGAYDGAVLWFQHEFNIFTDNQAFVSALRGLDLPKIVTFHTLHFQTSEAPSGLAEREFSLLRSLLPHVDAVTVFSLGAYGAVVSAFPQHQGRVHVIRHGVHSYPAIRRMSRRQAKEALNNYLLHESDLDADTKKALLQERVFLDGDTVIIGQTGFLHPIKGSEFLFPCRDALQSLVPDRRVVAVRIGVARQEAQADHAAWLRAMPNQKDKFLLEVWLPHAVLPLAQRAFDFNFYWPSDCAQSGVLSHALGAGAIIAGRDLEGVGEALKGAGALCDSEQSRLLLKMRDIIVDPALGEQVEQRAAEYAASYSWEKQAARHRELVQHVLPTLPVPATSHAMVVGDGSARPLTVRRR